MASNDMPIDDVDEFNRSWVGQQKVCYVTQDNEKQTIVRLNFPTLPMYLKNDVHNMVKNRKLDVTRFKQVQGFIMEQAFYQYFEEPKTFAVSNAESDCITFTVNEVREGEVKMIKNVLYRLRPYHPAIDFVGILTDKLDNTMLVLIQISKSSYYHHRSKIADIMANRNGRKGYTELTDDCPSILAFYQSKASDIICNLDPIYLYVSTETLSDGKDSLGYAKLKKDASLLKINFGVLSSESPLYKELIMHM